MMHARARSGVTAAILASILGLPAFAAPIEPFQPMTFLAGHCWKGSFDDGKQTDEHCFAWLYGGQALRDTHTVRAPGRPDYVGESTYYWNSADKRLEFLYIENAGGVSRGSVQPEEGALVFPATQFIANGESLTYRVRWTRLSDTSYEAWSEVRSGDAWKTMFRLTMKQSS